MRARLPQTDSIQELAEFWDTHDVTEFEAELEEIDDEQVFERSNVISLRLESSEADTIKGVAAAKGIAEAELIRSWIQEKIGTL